LVKTLRERKPIVGGNWKMNLNQTDSFLLLKALSEKLGDLDFPEIVIFPPFIWLTEAKKMLNSSHLMIGAQNVYWETDGPFTGEVNSHMLTDIVDYVLVGHSERRLHFGEEDAEINKKLFAVIESGLIPILAVGEQKHERIAQETAQKLRMQIETAFNNIENIPLDLVIAYEPIWAIGTGEPAHPEEAQESCALIREIMQSRFDSLTAKNIRIQYGGSINAANAAEFANLSDIDGLLVGSASLGAAGFAEICTAFV